MGVWPALLLTLVGFALIDSLNVLVIAAITAVVYDSRISRRSPVPGGLSLICGVFVATTTFGIGIVLGLQFLNAVVDFEITPTIRYWGELVLGLVLIAVAARKPQTSQSVPSWMLHVRRRPWLLGIAGLAVGFGQASTAIPYLTGLAMLSTHSPLPPAWPLIIVGYCAIAAVPSLLILLLSLRRTGTAKRIYRGLVRVITRYGPTTVRVLMAVIGLGLVLDALLHVGALW